MSSSYYERAFPSLPPLSRLAELTRRKEVTAFFTFKLAERELELEAAAVRLEEDEYDDAEPYPSRYSKLRNFDESLAARLSKEVSSLRSQVSALESFAGVLSPPVSQFVRGAADIFEDIAPAPGAARCIVSIPPLQAASVYPEGFLQALSSVSPFLAGMKFELSARSAGASDLVAVRVSDGRPGGSSHPSYVSRTMFVLPSSVPADLRVDLASVRKVFSDFRFSGVSASDALSLTCEAFASARRPGLNSGMGM